MYAADVMDPAFLREVAARCRARRPDIWMLGEIVNGDYGAWLLDSTFDSVIKYELYKSLWSSHRDGNYYELSWTLDRLFGQSGLCRNSLPLSFADNHDVTRIADQVGDLSKLPPLLALLVLSPGVPSTYYGSEARQTGVKGGVTTGVSGRISQLRIFEGETGNCGKCCLACWHFENAARSCGSDPWRRWKTRMSRSGFVAYPVDGMRLIRGTEELR